MLNNLYELNKNVAIRAIDIYYDIKPKVNNILAYFINIQRKGIDISPILKFFHNSELSHLNLEMIESQRTNRLDSDTRLKLEVNLLDFIQRRCKSIHDNFEEMKVETKDFSISDKMSEAYNTVQNISGTFNKWNRDLMELMTMKDNFDNMRHNWQRLGNRLTKAAHAKINLKFYLKELSKKIQLDRKQRKVIKSLGIDYSYRVVGDNNEANKAILLKFVINDIWMNVFRTIELGTDTDSSFTAPYGPIDSDGKAGKITFFVKFRIAGIASAVSSVDLNHTLTNTSEMWHYANPFRIYARTDVRSIRGRYVPYPYIEACGDYSNVCFGEYDTDVYQSIHSLNFVKLASILKLWSSNFSVGKTSPFNQPNYMWTGVPKKYGELAKHIGQDTHSCHFRYVKNTKDCIDSGCVLTETNSCPEYVDMSHEEELYAQNEPENAVLSN